MVHFHQSISQAVSQLNWILWKWTVVKRRDRGTDWIDLTKVYFSNVSFFFSKVFQPPLIRNSCYNCYCYYRYYSYYCTHYYYYFYCSSQRIRTAISRKRKETFKSFSDFQKYGFLIFGFLDFWISENIHIAIWTNKFCNLNKYI